MERQENLSDTKRIEAAVSSAAPTTELGLQRQTSPFGRSAVLGGLDIGWNSFIDDIEHIPDLKWPYSRLVFDKMRTDAQLAGLFKAMTYPTYRYDIVLNPNGARPDGVARLSANLNIPIVGEVPKGVGRQRDRFQFKRHQRDANTALLFGHSYFEQVGRIGTDGFWELRKLAMRMQRDIIRINVADDGGLISILQRFRDPKTFQMIEIPVDRLVAYVHEQEGPNWVGRSIFRDCYRNWLIKDRLLRVDAINHQRAGGVPVATAPTGASPAERKRLEEFARSFKVSEDAGGSVPQGTQFDIHKVGAGTDVIRSVRYHDETMARLMLHMFLQLGQTETGSRALGQTFMEYAFIAQKAIEGWFLGTFNEHVVEDWWDWNIGPEDQYVPYVDYIVEKEDEQIAAQDLMSLIQVGAIIVDTELEEYLRERYKLPVMGTTIQPENTAARLAAIAEYDHMREWHEQRQDQPVSRREFFRSLRYMKAPAAA